MGCSGNCDSCSSKEGCGKEPQNVNSEIKKIIGVVSGKGGVGKSLVTGMLASILARNGFKVGIIDGDITGPSIPKMFGLNERAMANELGILPVETQSGIKVMSINLLLENSDDPVIWRGPVIAGAVKQFWTDVVWGELDYLLIDMPPGTGDVPLTVFQSIPLDGVVIVSSPQELVSMIVKKAHTMAVKMNVPVLGLVENYSYIKCPDCGKSMEIFGKSKVESVAKENGIDNFAKIPFDSLLAKAVDDGLADNMYVDYLKEFCEKIIKNI